MMTTSNHSRKVSTRWEELTFFGVYFILFPMINMLQYRVTNKSGLAFWDEFTYFSISSVHSALVYYFYYAVIVPRFLFKRRWPAFALAVLAFLVCFDVLIRFTLDWPIAKAPFLAPGVRKIGAGILQNKTWVRQSIAWTLIQLVGVTALAYFIRSRQKERQVAQLERQQLQLELAVLKAQLQPHFFFNTMNNIYSLALQRSDTTAPVVEKLAGMMRYVLDEGTAGRVPLRQEVEFIGSYIHLERIRHDRNIRIDFDIQGEGGSLAIEPFLLLPLIENAFKHGIDNESREGFVEIVLVVGEKELTMQVCNSVPERSDSGENGLRSSGEEKQRNGVGLGNLRRRLALLYPRRHQLEVSGGQRSFKAFLNLSLLQ